MKAASTTAFAAVIVCALYSAHAALAAPKQWSGVDVFHVRRASGIYRQASATGNTSVPTTTSDGQEGKEAGDEEPEETEEAPKKSTDKGAVNDEESKPSPTPDIVAEKQRNATQQTFYPGDVVDVSNANSTNGASSDTANTATVANSTDVDDEVDGGGDDGKGDDVPDPDSFKPVLLGPPRTGRDTRCGNTILAVRQCEELDSLLAGAIHQGSIAFNANEEELDESQIIALVDDTEWDALGGSLKFSFCSLQSQHNRRTIVKRMNYNLQVVVDPAPNENGTLSWQPAGLEPGVEPPAGADKTAKPLPIFSVCIQPGGARGFESTRANMNFSKIAGYSTGRDRSFMPLTNQTTRPQENVQKLLKIACEKRRTLTNRTLCSVNPKARMTAVQEVKGTTAAIPERADVLLLGYERALLAESSIAIVIAGLFLKDAAEAADGERKDMIRKFLRFHILLALLIAIVSQSSFSLIDLFARVRLLRTGWIAVSIDRAWVLKNGLYALDISGEAVTISSHVPIRNRLFVLPVLFYAMYLVLVFFFLARPVLVTWANALFKRGKGLYDKVNPSAQPNQSESRQD